MEIRALSIYVYRTPRLGDCTNHGISSKYDTLLVACPDGNEKLDSENLPENFCMVENRHLFGKEVVPTIYPAEVNEKGEIVPRGDKWYMMGGNYGATSDSRFWRLVEGNGAVAIHDRYETPEEYAMYSR